MDNYNDILMKHLGGKYIQNIQFSWFLKIIYVNLSIIK